MCAACNSNNATRWTIGQRYTTADAIALDRCGIHAPAPPTRIDAVAAAEILHHTLTIKREDSTS
jgi:hypothetical protein